jgi:uncharacterized membrane protein YvbJ
MAIIKCTECGKEISDKAQVCIHCGCPVEAMNSNVDKSKNVKIGSSYYDLSKVEKIYIALDTLLLYLRT